MLDIIKLKNVIAKANLTNRDVAEKLGISITSFSYKLNGKRDFKLSEIEKLAEIFCNETVAEIFFDVV